MSELIGHASHSFSVDSRSANGGGHGGGYYIGESHGEESWLKENRTSSALLGDNMPIQMNVPGYQGGMPREEWNDAIGGQQRWKGGFHSPLDPSASQYGRGRNRRNIDSRDSWRSDERAWNDTLSWRRGYDSPGRQDSWRSQDRWTTSSHDSWRGIEQRIDSLQDGMANIDLGPGGFGQKQGKVGLSPSSQFFKSFGGGGGRGGTIPFGPSKSQNRYSTDILAKIYRQLLYTGKLRLPPAVSRDDPMLFMSEGEFVDVVEQLQGTERRPADYIDIHRIGDERRSSDSVQTKSHGVPHLGQPIQHSGAGLGAPLGVETMTPPIMSELASSGFQGEVDQWLYKDPQGVLQGPFSKRDIMVWFQAGFFPLTLEIRNVNDPPSMPFRDLASLLAIWNSHPLIQNQNVTPELHGSLIPVSSGVNISISASSGISAAIPLPESVQRSHLETQIPVPDLNPNSFLQTAPGNTGLQLQQDHSAIPTSVSDLGNQRTTTYTTVTGIPAWSDQVQSSHNQQNDLIQQQIPIGHVAEIQEQEKEIVTAKPRPETKVAPWVEKPSVEQPKKVSLLDIQREEDTKRAIAEKEAKSKSQAAASSGWVSVAKPVHSATSLAEIQKEEIQAKGKIVLDKDVFWDYDSAASAQRQSAPAPPQRPMQQPQHPIAPKIGGWAAAAAAAAAAPAMDQNATIPVVKAVPIQKPLGTGVTAPPPPPPPPRVERVEPKPSGMKFEEIPISGDARVLTGEFRSWCQEQMKTLAGTEDVTLCEFLMTVESNSEVADYVAEYLGTTPAAATFSAQFLNRKLAELAAGTGKKSRKARARAKAKATAAGATTSTSSATVELNEESDDPSWEKVVSNPRKGRAKEKTTSLVGLNM